MRSSRQECRGSTAFGIGSGRGDKKDQENLYVEYMYGRTDADEKAGAVFGQMMSGNQQAKEMAEANQEDRPAQ